MLGISEYSCQNWLVFPIAAAGTSSSATSRPRFLFVFSGVGHLNMTGGDGKFRHDTVEFLPNESLDEALTRAMREGAMQAPTGGYPRLRVEQWAPFATVSSSFNKNESINSGFSVDAWRPSPFRSVINIENGKEVGQIFSGIRVDVGVSDKDAVLLRLGYHVTLLGSIVFVSPEP